MKFVTYQSTSTETRLGVLDGDDVIDLAAADASVPSDLRTALLAGIDVAAAARKVVASSAMNAAKRMPLSSLKLAPLVPVPGKIVCLGHNYFEHAKEGGNLKPVYPQFFYRGASSLLAHGAPAMKPLVSNMLDYEAELVFVVGKQAKHIKRAQALDYVFGYACFNDITVRDYQKRTTQWTIGKNFDNTGAFGPHLVTADELPPGATGLSIQCRLNGQVMQNANTSDMIWGVAETIELLTECMTLYPGDVIVMGTPAGVGFARSPQVFMKDGDTVEIEIEGIGVLRNPIRNEIAMTAAHEAVAA